MPAVAAGGRLRDGAQPDDDAMDRLVRFFEFFGTCPSVVESFRQCPWFRTASAAHVHIGQLPDSCAVCSKEEREHVHGVSAT